METIKRQKTKFFRFFFKVVNNSQNIEAAQTTVAREIFVFLCYQIL